MADNFAARKCKKYKVVSMLPDVCMTPSKNGAPVAYPITIKLKASAKVSKNVNFNGDGAFLHKKSDTVKVKGDKPGQGKGIKSGTVGKKAESITSSPSVRINKKQLVRENDLFYMNNKNTIGQLTTTESGSESHITDEGKIAGKTIPADTNEASLWETVKNYSANKWEDVKYNATHFNDPETGFNAFYQDILGKDIASWTTDSIGAIGQATEDGYTAVTSGDYKGAGIAALTGVKKGHPLISKANKAYEKIDDALDKVDQAKDIANGEIPTGGGGKNKNKNKNKDKDKDKDKDEKDNSNNGGDNNNDGGKGKDDNKSQCKKIKIEIDGSDYPESKSPKPSMSSHTEEWTVSTETRTECKKRLKDNNVSDSTDAYKKLFKEDVNDKLPKDRDDFFKDTFGQSTESKTGDEAVKIVNDYNTVLQDSGVTAPAHKSNYHHLKPRWAHGHAGNKGGNEAGNLFPSPSGHQLPGGIHEWWDGKLIQADANVRKQLKKCPKIKNCKSEMGARLKECNITKLADCINKKSKGKSKLVVIYKG